MKTILFQGDSITDWGRNREQQLPNLDFGRGYVSMAAARILYDHPGKYTIYNRGIGGHRVVDLYARWKIDALNLKPDFISILIGVNDVWHEVDRQNGVEPERFEMVYRMMLEWTCQVLPGVKFLIMEPFALESDVVTPQFRADVEVRAAIAKKIAAEFDAIFLPLQDKLDAAAKLAPNAYWLQDGVHPAPAGAQLIADAWLEAAEDYLNN